MIGIISNGHLRIRWHDRTGSFSFPPLLNFYRRQGFLCYSNVWEEFAAFMIANIGIGMIILLLAMAFASNHQKVHRPFRLFVLFCCRRIVGVSSPFIQSIASNRQLLSCCIYSPSLSLSPSLPSLDSLDALGLLAN